MDASGKVLQESLGKYDELIITVPIDEYYKRGRSSGNSIKNSRLGQKRKYIERRWLAGKCISTYSTCT